MLAGQTLGKSMVSMLLVKGMYITDLIPIAEPQQERDAASDAAMETLSPLLRILPQYQQQFAWHVKVSIAH